MKDTLILAIESSCDETAASVVKNGRTILSNVISSFLWLRKGKKNLPMLPLPHSFSLRRELIDNYYGSW